MIIPEDILQHFPKIYRDNPDAGITALKNKINSILLSINTDIDTINAFKDVMRCPAQFLVELGIMLNAGINYMDSEIIKRKKILSAITSHKKRGTWASDAKLRIDAITGYDARISTSIDSSDWIMLGNSDDPDYYWGTMGVDGVDDSLGLDLIGAGTEIVISGNIYIDCHYGIHTSTLTSDQIAQIVMEIAFDVIPAYYKIYLGYYDVIGAFNVYPGGTIN